MHHYVQENMTHDWTSSKEIVFKNGTNRLQWDIVLSDCFSAMSNTCRIYLLLLIKYIHVSQLNLYVKVFENDKTAILIDSVNGISSEKEESRL